MAEGQQLRISSRVELIGMDVIGTVAYVGPTLFSSGKWVGIVLDDAKGSNNGTVHYRCYFTCEENHGLFVRPSQIQPLDESGEVQVGSKSDAIVSSKDAAPVATPIGGAEGGMPPWTASVEEIAKYMQQNCLSGSVLQAPTVEKKSDLEMTEREMKDSGCCCALCLEIFKDPRILPACGHTFCLKCLKQYGKNNETVLACPVCRRDIRVSDGGWEELPKNYSLSYMIESSAFVGPEEPTRVLNALVLKPEGYTCTKHAESKLQLYCIDCEKMICLECVDDAEHSSHKFSTISKTAADARVQLQRDLERIDVNLSLTRQERDAIEETKVKLLCSFAERELDIKREYDRIRSYIEEQRNTLDTELITLKTNLMKQIEIEKEDVEFRELSLKNFTNCVNDIDGQDKAANFRLVENLQSLNYISQDLLEMKTRDPGIFRMTNVTFKPTDFLNTNFFVDKKQNLIGSIEVNSNLSNDDSAKQLRIPYFGARSKMRASPVQETRRLTPAAEADDDNDSDNYCTICMDKIIDKKELWCKHKFCRG